MPEDEKSKRPTFTALHGRELNEFLLKTTKGIHIPAAGSSAEISLLEEEDEPLLECTPDLDYFFLNLGSEG
jgi:hypothetical protein